MKIGYFVNNVDLIKKIKNIPLTLLSTKEALLIRREIKKIEEEITLFEETQNAYIIENGEQNETGGYSIIDPDKIEKAKAYLNDLANQEVEQKWDPFFTEEFLEKVKEELNLTIHDIDTLENLGLLKLE